ncbi:MupA/Atu3671 family FMN-dependent luciferase-like monooxygenase [Kitasatospora sp. NPDC008050]|uniref:MupA/Atu3671 family FMN-dependent luciferase-like monooxygenase n=1 Tax=Kitasatospora sp. NPDC008050 TaxID=3364021 RepID=UPI0036F00E22
MDFSLFYFADESQHDKDRYRLLMEGARFADTHGFSAVWTPERHFHPFGGGYPNPALTSAAVAAVTERVSVRAGSVVAPLHSPVRIAEEWAVVDNLSRGRAGVSFASGWHSGDFAIRPENFADRKQVSADTVDAVRRLWRGEEIELADGRGEPIRVRIFPAPVQARIPVWLTTSGSVETFRAAGRAGLGILTHLLGQDIDELAASIAEYRRCFAEARAEHGQAGEGNVVLMLHTFLGADRESVRGIVHRPFSDYLRSSVGLSSRAGGASADDGGDELDPEDVDFMVEQAFNRYFETSGLFGTVDDALAVVRRLDLIGIDETACLIDFVGDTDAVLGALPYLDELRRAWASEVR